MPWTFPLVEVAGVLMSAWASIQRTVRPSDGVFAGASQRASRLDQRREID
jgi:hypothetical protein